MASYCPTSSTKSWQSPPPCTSCYITLKWAVIIRWQRRRLLALRRQMPISSLAFLPSPIQRCVLRPPSLRSHACFFPLELATSSSFPFLLLLLLSSIPSPSPPMTKQALHSAPREMRMAMAASGQRSRDRRRHWPSSIFAALVVPHAQPYLVLYTSRLRVTNIG